MYGLLAAAAGVALTLVPLLVSGFADVGGDLLLIASGALLGLWQVRPRLTLLAGGSLLLAVLLLGSNPPDTSLVVVLLYGALAGLALPGRQALLGALGYAGFTALMYVKTGDSSPGFLILTLPGFLAGTALRLRREEADRLVLRHAEVEAERAVLADLAVRHERTRIAAELHDIVGHALSVMVIQAAAGQRLESPQGSLQAIAEAARGGREDLRRLVELLGGAPASSTLSLVDELVERAVRSGLDVTCRLEEPSDAVPSEVQHVAFRVVQEGLTNALRHAPGAAVRVVVSGLDHGLRVSVENDQPSSAPLTALGAGSGLTGLRDRVASLGGSFSAGPADRGWSLVATLPGAGRSGESLRC